MNYLCCLLILCFAGPGYVLATDLEPQISKFEFQGVHFGDFPSVDMICVRGLCPVGEVGVGISDNSVVPPAYNQQRAITHYHGAKISTPEFGYFDDKMYMVRFSIECRRQGVNECVDAVKNGLDAEYGLTPVKSSRNDDNSVAVGFSEFLTEAGSFVSIHRYEEGEGRVFPSVRIFDPFLMNGLRRSFNPDYVSLKIEIFHTEEATVQ